MPTTPTRSRLTSAALWLIAIGLLANVLIHLTSKSAPNYPLEFSQTAFAQNVGAPGMLGARGIYMMPAQLGTNVFGCYLIDLDSSTLVIYRVDPMSNRFKLMAVRSFKNDRFLEDFNNDSPTPKEVKKLVDTQRLRNELNNPDTQPDTKPDDKDKKEP